MDWLEVLRGDQPLIVSIPHAGTAIPPEIEGRLVSPERARVDADWWVDQLYGFAEAIGATVVRTAISRTVIDVNRDPSGASLYPGQATTGLCPDTTSTASRSIGTARRRTRRRSPSGGRAGSSPIMRRSRARSSG